MIKITTSLRVYIIVYFKISKLLLNKDNLQFREKLKLNILTKPVNSVEVKQINSNYTNSIII